ncbi:MAG: undecaprenyl-diphosphate phosphatase [Alloprevotella sp.]|nr:undecaprenyl-diphosphate phosphatase [Prevotella sp.]MBR1712760.1 undecaprenyl-diphosphate phosphatase [Alloprevotella sp.]
MGTLEALLLGIVQGLTEYLPVSSSGHLAIGSALLGTAGEENLMFTVAVHIATVLSTLVVLWREIIGLLKGTFHPLRCNARGLERLNNDQRYVLAILVSMIPIGIVGLFFKDKVEEIFGSGLFVVGCCLLVTAALLGLTAVARPRRKERISLRDGFIIGLAQALAVLPGLSRSGATIATGLLLGNKKSTLAQFSFLMVIPPILGEALLDTVKVLRGGVEAAFGGLSLTALSVGFIAAFVSGIFACKWMIGIVRRGKLIYFAAYCGIVGLLILIFGS